MLKIKINKQDITCGLQFLILVAVYSFGIILAYNARNLMERVSVKPGALALGCLLLVIVGYKKKLRSPTNIFWLLVLSLTSGMVAALLNDAFALVMASVCVLLAFLMLSGLSFPSIEKEYTVLVLPMTAAALVGYLQYGVPHVNSAGIIYLFTGVVVLNYLNLKKKSNFMLYAAIVVLFVGILAATRSRTSMMCFLISSVITYHHLFMKKKSYRNFFLILLLLAVFVVGFGDISSFFNRIFLHKWGNADISSGRFALWQSVFRNLSLIGNGTSALERGDVHNSFFQLLHTFGVVNFVFFILLMLCIFRTAFCVKNRTVYLIFFIAWSAASMFESLEFSTSRMIFATLLFLVHVVLLHNEYKWTVKDQISDDLLSDPDEL